MVGGWGERERVRKYEPERVLAFDMESIVVGKS